MKWWRAIIYGVLLWLIPFAVAFVLFGIREDNRALFESLITVTGVLSAVTASLIYFRDAKGAGLPLGIGLGLFWASISIAIDLPIFLAIFRMPLADYAADIALTYLSFPIIAGGIALAKSS